MAAPWHLQQKNNVHVQRVHVVLRVPASSAVLLIRNSWPCSCSSSSSCSWHCVEKKNKQQQKDVKYVQLCLFVCLFALLWFCECTYHSSHFSFNVSLLQQIWSVHFPFFFQFQPEKQNVKNKVLQTTLCGCVQSLIQSVTLSSFTSAVVFSVYWPFKWSRQMLSVSPSGRLSDAVVHSSVALHRNYMVTCWMGVEGEVGGVGWGRHGQMSGLPLNSDLQYCWHSGIMSNSVVPGWLGAGLYDGGALNPKRPAAAPTGCNQITHERPWISFFFFSRYLSKWAWERTVSSAVSQSVYRHGWLITEREIYGYNEGENRTGAQSCCCAPVCVCARARVCESVLFNVTEPKSHKRKRRREKRRKQYENKHSKLLSRCCSWNVQYKPVMSLLDVSSDWLRSPPTDSSPPTPVTVSTGWFMVSPVSLCVSLLICFFFF